MLRNNTLMHQGYANCTGVKGNRSDKECEDDNCRIMSVLCIDINYHAYTP